MTKPSFLLTDNQLAAVYLKLQERYRQLSENQPFQMIYNQLAQELHAELFNSQSALSTLLPDEKRKVWTVFNTFFYSCQQYRQLRQQDRPPFRFDTQPPLVIQVHSEPYYCPSNDLLFTWLLLDTLSWRPYQDPGVGCCLPSNHHGHAGVNDVSLEYLFFLLVSAVLLAVSTVTLYYLLSAVVDNLERMILDEGWFQAVINLSSIVASGMVVAYLSELFLSAPLMALAVSAGITNPIGIVVVGIVCLSILGAGLGYFITNAIQDSFIASIKKDSLDPHDSFRFDLTKNQELMLMAKGFDIVKVKCALVALHEEIGKTVPSCLSRFFCDQDKQKLLDQVRKMRCGDIESPITIGTGQNKKVIDLRPFVMPVVQVEFAPRPLSTVHTHASMSPPFAHPAESAPPAPGFWPQQQPVPSAPPAPGFWPPQPASSAPLLDPAGSSYSPPPVGFYQAGYPFSP